MNIDNNQKEKAAMDAFKRGDKEQGHKLQDEFLQEFKESKDKKEDHCSCKSACKLHGKCMECVAVHRAHQDHLPNCFMTMVNERIEKLSELTEHSFKNK